MRVCDTSIVCQPNRIKLYHNNLRSLELNGCLCECVSSRFFHLLKFYEYADSNIEYKFHFQHVDSIHSVIMNTVFMRSFFSLSSLLRNAADLMWVIQQHNDESEEKISSILHTQIHLISYDLFSRKYSLKICWFSPFQTILAIHCIVS